MTNKSVKNSSLTYTFHLLLTGKMNPRTERMAKPDSNSAKKGKKAMENNYEMDASFRTRFLLLMI